MINQKLETFLPVSFISGCFCVGIFMGLWMRIGYMGGWDAVITPTQLEPQLPKITLPPTLQEQLIQDNLTIQAQEKSQYAIKNEDISTRIIQGRESTINQK